MNTLGQLLVRTKDKIILKEQVVEPVYHISCDSCDASHIGETERSLKARLLEHRRPSSTTSSVTTYTYRQSRTSGDMVGVKILAVEP